MADFNKPTVDSHYTQFPNEIRAAVNAALSFLDGGSHTNIPMKSKRWNPISKIFEEYSGTQWVPMATEYKLPVDYNVLLNKPVPSSATNSDSGTQFASSKAVKDGMSYALKKVSDIAENRFSSLANADGYKHVGRCKSVEMLRKVVPSKHGQRILVDAYYEGGTTGGGEFVADLQDLTTADDGGSCF
ncbi:phage tail protein, partial [Pasteurella multocida]|nr:phage tail protein [Pasteurella multocida]MDY0444750.1 phage tail protein [Pasteurella multocida]MDY0513792.1 phage tail protein [Pasteurella multocida]MDY0527627.1 phage tail protein [Pasteurella multocida]